MKRDMDLIRELMLLLEDRPIPAFGIEWLAPETIQVAGRGAAEIGYHLSLLVQAGFIEAGGADTTGMRLSPGIAFRGLSWTGHDFLESVRSPDVWDRTKEAAKSAGGFTVDLRLFATKTYLEGRIKRFISG